MKQSGISWFPCRLPLSKPSRNVVFFLSSSAFLQAFAWYESIWKGYSCFVSLSQWPTFKLLGITYLIGKIKFKLLFHDPLAIVALLYWYVCFGWFCILIWRFFDMIWWDMRYVNCYEQFHQIGFDMLSDTTTNSNTCDGQASCRYDSLQRSILG